MAGRAEDLRPAETSATLLARAREQRAHSKALVARVLESQERSRLLIERSEHRLATTAETLRLHDELRQSVRDYAAVLRQLGEPPEKAVVNVKEIAWEAAQTLDHPLRLRPLDRQDLVNDLVRWTVAAYFGH